MIQLPPGAGCAAGGEQQADNSKKGKNENEDGLCKQL